MASERSVVMQAFLTEVSYCPIQICLCLLTVSWHCGVTFSLLRLFPFWDTGLLCHVTQAGLDPIILFGIPSAGIAGVDTVPGCKGLPRSLQMYFSVSSFVFQSKRCLANSTFSCDSDFKSWLFLWTSSFIHCGHNHSNVFRWMWDSCLQLWIAAEFTCTNVKQNVRGLLFTP